MSLIVDRKDVKTSFINEWSKFVPAIIAYGQKSTKKSIITILSSLDIIGISYNMIIGVCNNY